MDEKIKNILEDHEERLKKIEENLKNSPDSDEIVEKVSPEDDIESKILELIDNVGIERDDFDSIFHLKDKDISLLNVPEGTEGEKQLKSALCFLTAHDHLLDSDFITSLDLNKKLKKLGIKSLNNLSRNLGKDKQLLLPEGISGSKNFGFRLTVPGKKRGYLVIKELLKK